MGGEHASSGRQMESSSVAGCEDQRLNNKKRPPPNASAVAERRCCGADVGYGLLG